MSDYDALCPCCGEIECHEGHPMSDKTSLRELLRKWRELADKCEFNALEADSVGWDKAARRMEERAQHLRECADEVDAALARSEAQGESDRVTWNLLYQELRAAIDNGNESMTHAEALEWIADRRNTPADRAPGEVEAKALAGGLESIVGKTSNVNDNWILREAAALIRRLAARAPSAQAVAKLTVYEDTRAITARIHDVAHTLPPGTYALYTSAPAAGDGECPACRGTGMEIDGSGRAIPREWCEKCDATGLAHPTAGEQQGEGNGNG